MEQNKTPTIMSPALQQVIARIKHRAEILGDEEARTYLDRLSLAIELLQHAREAPPTQSA